MKGLVAAVVKLDNILWRERTDTLQNDLQGGKLAVAWYCIGKYDSGDENSSKEAISRGVYKSVKLWRKEHLSNLKYYKLYHILISSPGRTSVEYYPSHSPRSRFVGLVQDPTMKVQRLSMQMTNFQFA